MTFAVRTHLGDLTAGPVINLVISANTQSYNIHSAAVSAYGSEPPTNSTINLTVNSGVTVGSALPASTSYIDNAGIRTGSFTNSGINIIMLGSGNVLGYGGGPFSDPNWNAGASFGSGGPVTGAPGYKGGDAFWIESGVTVNFSSYSGTIAGGGGGGGGGTAPNSGDGAGGGGGGAGSSSGFGGTFGHAAVGHHAGSAGTAGTSTNGGQAGSGGTGSGPTTGGTAGTGSGSAAPGVRGADGITGVGTLGAGGGGGGGGLGAAGGNGGDLATAQGVASGGAAGAWVRRVGGAGTVVGTPATSYGPIKNT